MTRRLTVMSINPTEVGVMARTSEGRVFLWDDEKRVWEEISVCEEILEGEVTKTKNWIE